MNTTVNFQPDFPSNSSFLWLLGLFLFVTALITFIKYRRKKKKEKLKNKAKAPQKKVNKAKNTLSPIQTKYLKEIDKLCNACNEDKISVKNAYQELSILYRRFVYEFSGIDLTNKTLSELEGIGKPIIYELISGYYNPEFDYVSFSKNDFNSAVDQTRKVVTEWK